MYYTLINSIASKITNIIIDLCKNRLLINLTVALNSTNKMKIIHSYIYQCFIIIIMVYIQ